jgi:hypothetical protein
MHLQALSAGTNGAGAANEDAIGSCDGAFWVLDGATGLGGPFVSEKSDAQWFASHVSAGLSTVLREPNTEQTADILSGVLVALESEFTRKTANVKLQRHELPAAAFCMARLLGARIEFSWAADCKGYLFRGDDLVETIGGGALEALDGIALSQLRDVLSADPHLNLAAARDAIRPTLIKHRSLMNAAEGYRVLTPMAASAAGLSYASADVHAGDDILLATDGFYCLWETYEPGTLAAVLGELRGGVGDAVVRRLRDIERADPDGRKYTRFKVHDDVSWALMRVIA